MKFLRMLIVDRRLPWYIRVLPLVVLVYWISPVDLIPFFPFDDVAIAMLVLAMMVWLTPRDLISEAAERRRISAPVAAAGLGSLSGHPLPDPLHPGAFGAGVVQADPEMIVPFPYHLLHAARLGTKGGQHPGVLSAEVVEVLAAYL